VSLSIKLKMDVAGLSEAGTFQVSHTTSHHR